MLSRRSLANTGCPGVVLSAWASICTETTYLCILESKASTRPHCPLNSGARTRPVISTRLPMTSEPSAGGAGRSVAPAARATADFLGGRPPRRTGSGETSPPLAAGSLLSDSSKCASGNVVRPTRLSELRGRAVGTSPSSEAPAPPTPSTLLASSCCRARAANFRCLARRPPRRVGFLGASGLRTSWLVPGEPALSASDSTGAWAALKLEPTRRRAGCSGAKSSAASRASACTALPRPTEALRTPSPWAAAGALTSLMSKAGRSSRFEQHSAAAVAAPLAEAAAVAVVGSESGREAVPAGSRGSSLSGWETSVAANASRRLEAELLGGVALPLLTS
mmetsp:Transcript_33920/g.74263  ORF Transcript_33920/g.74263 Transcript_33920/m.74263 type:complete len:336 (+) Transcript_33920:318-1325(+)